MLQSGVVLFIENFMIHRHNITIFFAVAEHGLLMHPGGSCTEPGSFCEIANFAIRIVGENEKNNVPASWLAGVWPLGPFCDEWKIV